MTSKLDILNHARENDGDQPYDKYTENQKGWRPIHKTNFKTFRHSLHENTLTELIGYHHKKATLLFATRHVDKDSYAMVQMTEEMYGKASLDFLKKELKFRTDYIDA